MAVDILAVVRRAQEIFGPGCLEWMGEKNQALGDRTPWEMLIGSDAEAQQVVDVIGRIEHGLFE